MNINCVYVVNNFIAIVFSRNNHLHFFYFNIFYLKKSEIPIQEDKVQAIRSGYDLLV